jgi:hypothetical protein
MDDKNGAKVPAKRGTGHGIWIGVSATIIVIVGILTAREKIISFLGLDRSEQSFVEPAPSPSERNLSVETRLPAEPKQVSLPVERAPTKQSAQRGAMAGTSNVTGLAVLREDDFPVSWNYAGRTYISEEIAHTDLRPAPPNAQFQIAGGHWHWEPPFDGPLLERGKLEGHDVLIADRIIDADFQVIWREPATGQVIWAPIYERFRTRDGVFCTASDYHFRPVWIR